MAGFEPLIQEVDPHITKLAIGGRMKDKDGPNKKYIYYAACKLKHAAFQHAEMANMQ